MSSATMAKKLGYYHTPAMAAEFDGDLAKFQPRSEEDIKKIRGPKENLWNRQPHPVISSEDCPRINGVSTKRRTIADGSQGSGIHALSVKNPWIMPDDERKINPDPNDNADTEYTSGYVSLADILEDDKAPEKKKWLDVDLELNMPALGCSPTSYHQDNFASILYLVPVFNLIWTFVDTELDPPSWAQICRLLDTFAIVTALSLALTCTFLSAITYDEMRGANFRFQAYGFDSDSKAWDGDWTITVNGDNLNGYMPLNSLANYETNASVANAFTLASSGETFMPQLNPWSVSAPFDDPIKLGSNCTGNPLDCLYNITCAAPCFYDRYVSEYKIIDSKYYSMWQAGESDKATSPLTSQFARDCSLSNGFMVTSLFLAITVLALGSPNIFFRDGNRKINGYFRGGNENVEGHQYRTIAKSYFFWVRWAILVVVIFAMVGIVFFFQGAKFLTYIKYPDYYLEQNRGRFVFGLSPPKDDPYSQAQSYLVMFFWLPILVAAILLSLGHRAAYLYPIHSRSTMSDPSNYVKRLALRMDMIKFLHFECNVYSHTFQHKGELVERKNRDMTRFGPKESLKDLWSDPDPISLELRRGVYGAGAGGVSATEAEVVADSLIDNAFCLPEDLIDLKVHGAQAVLYELPAVHYSVVGLIINACTRLINSKSFKYRGFGTNQKPVEFRLAGDNEGDGFRPYVRL